MSVLHRIEIPATQGHFSGLAGGPPLGQAPLIHFAHATGMNAETYRPLLESLCGRYTVRALDLRGHGLSTVPAEASRLRSWSRYAQDLAAVLGQWGQKAILVGHSMGGAISADVAARHPELAAALLLIDPAVVPAVAAPAFYFARLTGLTGRIPLAERASKRQAVWPSREVMVKAYSGRGAFKTWRPGFLEAYVAGGTRDNPDGTVSLTCAPEWEAKTFSTIGLTFWRGMARVRCPVAALYAETESTLRAQGAQSLAAIRPGSAVTQVPGSTHFIPMEFPDVVVDAIDTLVARI
ncbi:alpha/beta hydrolase [Zavarzinia compransoris]|uniref:alpha/beta fold hydrolase n=1 Tax=Zavarzinia marina TaxID=2911065 RepID=UPI001F22C155|nr:alpha/beta hydrolase [Zavarzinia marina]MCF4166485.1 alpha/beta hydrolase [Zavarzinia marina]